MKMTGQEASKIIEQYRMCSSGDCPTLECADCEYNHDPRKVEEAFLMAIDALESAQPEIIWCRDCKHWRDSDGKYRRGIGAESKCPLNLQAVYDGEFYCGFAERRTDAD